MGARQEPLDHRPHGMRAQHQRLLPSPPVKHAIGEDMSALEIGPELHLVDGQKGDVEVARHGFDSQHPVARIGRLDLLLAGDECNGLRRRRAPPPCCKPRAPSSRSGNPMMPDEWPSMRSMARWVLPVLVGPEHGSDACAACADVAVGKGREGNRHGGLEDSDLPRWPANILQSRNGSRLRLFRTR